MQLVCPHCRSTAPLTEADNNTMRCRDCGKTVQVEQGANLPETLAAVVERGAASTLVVSSPLVDQEIKGPVVPGYELLGVLGRGGMGVVYKARQVGLNRTVALKMILGGGHAGPEGEARFRIEAEAVARLQHPNIVQIFEVGQADGNSFFSLEYCAGGSLATRLAGKPQEPLVCAALAETLARAMHEAHRLGIVHRDLKPANVLLGGETETPLEQCAAKISDFGLAKQLGGESGRTQTGQVLGTPSYMAPEQATGKPDEIGPRTDVYALGAILYECLTGRPPFLGATLLDTLEQVCSQEPVPPRRIQPRCPADLETICLKALHKEPGRRYGSAEEVAEDLRRFRAGEPILARPVGNIERAAAWARRKPAVAGLSAAVVAVALLGLALVLISWQAEVVAREDAQLKEKAAVEAKGKEEEARLRAEDAKKLEEIEKTKAVTAQLNEEIQRKIAQELEKKAVFSLYTTSLLLAYREWASNDVKNAEAILDQCPEALRGWEWRYLKKLCGGELLSLSGNHAMLAFSPDGKRLHATVLTDQQPLAQAKGPTELKTWDAVTGQLLHSRKFSAEGAILSPDGTTLIGLDRSEAPRVSLKRWSVETGAENWSIPAPVGVTTFVFSPNGRFFTAISNKGDASVWDTSDGNLLHTRRLPEQLAPGGILLTGAKTFALHPDGKRLAFVVHTRILKTMDLSTGKEATMAMRKETGALSIRRLAFSPDGERLLLQTAWPLWQVFETETGRPLLTLPAPTGVTFGNALFSPDSRKLAATSPDSACTMHDIHAGQELLGIRSRSAYGGVDEMAFSPDGFRLAIQHDGGRLRIWDVTARPEYREVPRNGGMAMELAFSPDGRHLACACEGALGEGGVTRINVHDVWGGELIQIFNNHKADPQSVAFLPDGERLLSADDAGEAKVWDLKTARELASFNNAGHSHRAVAIHPDGKRAAFVGSKNGELNGKPARVGFVFVRDLESKAEVFRASLSSEAIQVRWGKDGKGLIAATRAGEVVAWDTTDWREQYRSRSEVGSSAALALNKDGTLLASLTSGPAVRGKPQPPSQLKVWDAKTGQLMRTTEVAHGASPALAFSPNGERLAYSSGVTSRTAHLLDMASGREMFTFQGLEFGATRIAFSADGESIALGGLSQTVRIYDSGGTTDAARLARRKALDELTAVKHIREGEVAVHKMLPGVALFHFNRVAQAMPDNPVVRLMRASALAQLEKWDEAADDYAIAMKAGPVPLTAWEQAALVQLQRPDRKGYRELCERLLERTVKAMDPQILDMVVRIGAMGTGGPDSKRLLEIQEKVIVGTPRFAPFLATLGMVYYRTGKYEEAIKRLSEAEPRMRPPDPFGLARGTAVREAFYLAMAYHKADKAREAKEWYDKAVKGMDAPVMDMNLGFGGPSTSWERGLELRTLRKEAEETLQIGKP